MRSRLSPAEAARYVTEVLEVVAQSQIFAIRRQRPTVEPIGAYFVVR